MFVKLAFHNAKGKLQDYLIYLLTLTMLAAIMLSAFMLESFPIFTENTAGVFIANSLPYLIALTLLSLMIYINNFMLRRRSQEFAILMLSGAPKGKICILYFVEHTLFGLLSLISGLILGVLLFFGILTVVSAEIRCSEIVLSALRTILYFSVVHIFSLIIMVFYIKKLNIKNMLYRSKHNEKSKATTMYLIPLTITTVLAYATFYFMINNFTPLTASMIVFVVGFILYGTNSTLLGWLAWYRNRQGIFLYRNHRLFIIGQLLSRIKTHIRMSTVISGCLLISIISTIHGTISIACAGEILGEQFDMIMGFAQIYIAVLFAVTAFSIIALQQIVDSREHKQKYFVLKQLGTDAEHINRLLLQSIILNFTVPVFSAVVFAYSSIVPIEYKLRYLLHRSNLVVSGLITFTIIFAILYICYITAVFLSLKRAKNEMTGFGLKSGVTIN
jgi:hypothetical protein